MNALISVYCQSFRNIQVIHAKDSNHWVCIEFAGSITELLMMLDFMGCCATQRIDEGAINTAAGQWQEVFQSFMSHWLWLFHLWLTADSIHNSFLLLKISKTQPLTLRSGNQFENAPYWWIHLGSCGMWKQTQSDLQNYSFTFYESSFGSVAKNVSDLWPPRLPLNLNLDL